jgi:hypothetical protein
MTNQHPIKPLPELVMEWVNNHYGGKVHRDLGGVELSIAAQAAQWGADQELEACCEQTDELQLGTCYPVTGDKLRAARRPKPPSEADQALAALKVAPKVGVPTIAMDVDQYDTILRALQRLKELEKPNV